jgi:uncharacterized protein YheU (UPF0270 family)
MQIPYEMTPPETLRNLIEEFVTREGTNYGDREFALETLIEQVLKQIKRGEAVVVFDPDSETTSIVPKAELH